MTHHCRLMIDDRIDTTGDKFFDCTFNGCILECRDAATTKFDHCIFIECRFIGAGWPQYILEASL